MHVRELYPTFFGPDAKKSGDLCRIINDRNFARLSRLLDATDGKIAFGGSSDAKERFMGLTVVTDVKEGDSLMSEELFGPILPIVTVDSVEEAIK